MVFNITKLDKVQLIQALYVHSETVGMGKSEYDFRDAMGQNVIGLTEEECNDILSRDVPGSNGYLLDYHNGKPMKLHFAHKKNGDIWVCSDSYDSRSGRYRFLEALLSVFSVDEIVIVKKGYPQHLTEMIANCTKREKEETSLLKNMLSQTIKEQNGGSQWIFDTSKVRYRPPFMRHL